MKKIKSHYRKINCECGNKLLSVYVRSKTTFKSLENLYYCENCDKVFLLKEDKLELNSNGKVYKGVDIK